MPFKADTYRVMIASPSDLMEERQAATDAINDWNTQNTDYENTVLLPIKWETHAVPQSGIRPQAAINEQLVHKSDILVALFWTKIGTNTGVAASGTIEEIEGFEASGKPVLRYFSSRPIDINRIDPKQYEELKKYQEIVYQTGLNGKFDSPEELRRILLKDLTAHIRKMRSSRPLQPSKVPDQVAEISRPNSSNPQYGIEHEKQEIIKQLKSEDKITVFQALEVIRQQGWFQDKSLKDIDLKFADLSGLDLSGIHLHAANFYGATLNGVNLRGAYLHSSKFHGAKLQGANLSEADLSHAQLNGADLTEANLQNAYMHSVELANANLSRANLREADLNVARIWGCNLEETDFTSATFLSTVFTALDLTQAKGLEATQHRGMSYIDVETVYKSKDKLPEAFLRGCGVPEDLIIFFVTHANNSWGKSGDLWWLHGDLIAAISLVNRGTKYLIDDKLQRCLRHAREVGMADKKIIGRLEQMVNETSNYTENEWTNAKRDEIIIKLESIRADAGIVAQDKQSGFIP